MFCDNVKATLLCGPKELSQSFMFEAALHWAESGRRVIYIMPAPLKSKPAPYHDRDYPTVSTLKLIRFIYLADYETLMQQLIKLHTYAVVPSVLLIDDLDNYLNEISGNDANIYVARICSLILHSMKSCSRISKMDVDMCVWSSSILVNNVLSTTYFRNVWNLTEEEDGREILLEKYFAKSSFQQSYRYYTFEDGMRVLKQILCDSMED